MLFRSNIKTLDSKISNKIIVPLKGIEENAKLLAKELKLSIWENATLNMLLKLYARKRMAIL